MKIPFLQRKRANRTPSKKRGRSKGRRKEMKTTNSTERRLKGKTKKKKEKSLSVKKNVPIIMTCCRTDWGGSKRGLKKKT